MIVLFLVSWIFIGNYVLLNLFLASLLSGFESDDVNEDIKFLEQDFEIGADLAHLNQNQLTAVSYMTQTLHPGTKNEQELNTLKKQITANMSAEDDETDNGIFGSSTRTTKQSFKYFEGVHCEKSFFVLTKQNKFRKACYRIVKHQYFETIILFLIIIRYVPRSQPALAAAALLIQAAIFTCAQIGQPAVRHPVPH